MDERENWLRAVRFEGPERIPVNIGMSAAAHAHYPPDAIDELKEEHQLLFPGFRKKERSAPDENDFLPFHRAGRPYTDGWGNVWETKQNGMTGSVVQHAIPNWEAFSEFSPPSPEEHDGWVPIDWSQIRENIAAQREAGRLTTGRLHHGHTFLTLTYLRGYENLIFDMCDEHPRLTELLDMVEEFNLGHVYRYLELGVDRMHYPEDLGMQQGPMLTPKQFRRYIKASYQRLISPAQDAGCVITMHSDGDIRELTEDLLDAGIELLNLQDLVNGIDWIEANLKGRVCINLDIDRQSVTRFGTPAQIDDHIRSVVEKLGSREGGLMLIYGLYPGVPLANVKAVMDAMEKYSMYYS